MEINLEKVTSDSQIEKTATIAAEIWKQHFTPIIGAAQVEYMLKNFQSISAISAQIRQQNYQYFIAKNQKKDLGYIAVQPRKNELFLSKFYIFQKNRGQGVGKKIFAEIIRIAKEFGASEIALNVNRKNTDTISVYQHLGFKITCELNGDIGNGFVTNDYEMKYLLKNDTPETQR